jgi:hypothetical protein
MAVNKWRPRAGYGFVQRAFVLEFPGKIAVWEEKTAQFYTDALRAPNLA